MKISRSELFVEVDTDRGGFNVVLVLDIQCEFVFGSRRWRRPEPLVSVPGQRSRRWWCSWR